MKILISGIAGVLGSALTEKFLKMGLVVRGVDVCRIDEAWRLIGVKDSIEYSWRASTDLSADDFRGIDIVVDAGLGVADRPLGNSSPEYTMDSNVQPSFHILESVKQLPVSKRPTVIYPSSFNALYGYPNGTTYNRQMLPNPSSVYGWTKASVELLYMTYHKAHGIPCVVTRVGSGYGPRMRSDELPARLVLNVLRDQDLIVRSPNSRRLWTYIEDITNFYGKLVDNLDQYVGQTLHCAGNAKNEIITNLALARLITIIGRKDLRIRSKAYEPGEMVDGKPISFGVESRSPLWKPKFSLREGLSKTYDWFKQNFWRFN